MKKPLVIKRNGRMQTFALVFEQSDGALKRKKHHEQCFSPIHSWPKNHREKSAHNREGAKRSVLCMLTKHMLQFKEYGRARIANHHRSWCRRWRQWRRWPWAAPPLRQRPKPCLRLLCSHTFLPSPWRTSYILLRVSKKAGWRGKKDIDLWSPLSLSLAVCPLLASSPCFPHSLWAFIYNLVTSQKQEGRRD